MIDRSQANKKMLKDATDIQQKTKEAVNRIQNKAAEAEGLGIQTLEELRRQGQQMDDINMDIDASGNLLDRSAVLQTKFDAWAGNWWGGKKKAALREASAEIQARHTEEQSKIREVFQQERLDTFTRTWKKAGLVLCTNPAASCDDVFDPYIQENLSNSSWVVDFSQAGIDAEGWTYSYDFATLNKNGAGEPVPNWKTFVRRRKWRYAEKKTGSAAVDKIRDRNNARLAKAPAQSRQAEKIGFVPRNQTVNLTASGLTSAGMMSGKPLPKDQELDEESAEGLRRIKENDREIDDGIDGLSRSIDNLANIAKTMKEETIEQNKKLDRMEDKMAKTTEKQTVVNARQRYLLK